RWFQELSTQGIFTTDTALVITSWNRRLEEISGLTAAEVVGRPLLHAIPELGGEPRVLAQGFHRYLIPAAPGAPNPSQSARIAPLEFEARVIGTIAIV